MPTEPLVDLGEGDPIVLLHGLFGSLSNWTSVIDEFTSSHRVLVPRLPLYSNPISDERLNTLVDYVHVFIEEHIFINDSVIFMGNSLGGHIALLYAWRHPERIKKLILTGSSGLFENAFGGSFPHVRDYNYIKEKIEDTFYKREVVTKELVDEIYETLQSRAKTLSIIGLAREAQRHNVANILGQIATPTLLIWGRQDIITPPKVALEFQDRLINSNVIFLEDCGHVPMMEQPILFNKHVREFLSTK